MNNSLQQSYCGHLKRRLKNKLINPANNSPCLNVTTVKLRFLKLIFPLICENECHDLRNLWDSACNPAHKNSSLPVNKFTLIFFTAGSEN